MYILIVYDVGEKRVQKVLKFIRKHLIWIQNSVFEGNVTKAELLKIKNGLKEIVDQKEDSIIFFTARNERWIKKEIMGREKNATDNFI
ncbi:MAG: CRISPR-associated endonuclease Cas2 [Clostridia bacterium]|nr:CRISPR-associated endonuclease Cas2 [Clostridia bacterium]